MMHIIAAKAVAFKEALQPEFKTYSAQVIKNMKVISDHLTENGFELSSGGTDNHLILIDLRNKGITGKVGEAALEKAGITTNKNMVPFDDKSPFVTSGVRLGTPAITSRGMKETEMKKIADWIGRALNASEDETTLDQIRKEVLTLCNEFPIYTDLLV